MATFSATDAGLSGFTLARSRPRVFLVWGLILLAISLVTTAATILMVGQAMVDMQAASQTGDQEATMRSMTALAPFYIVALPLSLLYYGIATAAVNRMVLRPDDSRNAFIRLGGDELRMIVVMIAQWLIGVGVVIVAVLLAFAVQSIVALVLGGGLAGVTSLFQPDMSTLAAFFTPAMLVYTVIGGFLSALSLMVMYAPAATIYRAIAEPAAADVFS
jgi:hypothetical protein